MRIPLVYAGGPELPGWLIICSSERGKEWIWTGLSGLESLLFPVWPFRKVLSLMPVSFVSTIFTPHEVLPSVQHKPLMAISLLLQFSVREMEKLPKTMVIGK